jgi:hypothetical protein
VVVGEAGAGQVAVGLQHGGEVPGLDRVEHGEQLAGGGAVLQLVGGTGGGLWPLPAQAFVADLDGAGVCECGAARRAADGGRFLTTGME